MRKPLVLLACLCVVAVGAVAFAVLPSDSEPDRQNAGAQDQGLAPIFESEAYQWCVESCSGGNDSFTPNDPASFELRADGSLHFTTDVNYSACPSLEIPEGIDGWYFGTLRQDVDAALATATVQSEGVQWPTTGVQPIDEASRNNPDLVICEALFVRGE